MKSSLLARIITNVKRNILPRKKRNMLMLVLAGKMEYISYSSLSTCVFDFIENVELYT